MTEPFQLRYSATSPFVRKVMVVAMETGLADRFERIGTNPWDAKTDLPKDNPLCKVPALKTPEGWLYDSLVICEYLDSLHPGAKLFPPPGPARWQALRHHALADGAMDAAILRRLESQRPEGQRSQGWMDRQKALVERVLDALEKDAKTLVDLSDIGAITIAVMLGYLDFRFAADEWRKGRPRLAAWYGRVSQNASMLATVPKDPA
ncbi:glutathione S-transferase [Hypericibacter adhaerens]|uniref:Glutathione S-transferase n=1 Tax=Hypericibacter adhaerens TaxID=2602016 RepID=A0A5J6N3J9_9PROT|nr:glutathione S-transferase N-terminal domain-containing protein [Hypericibacter adhaerens]QEX24518.1 glutathione S-transferase [Hypericibacter adhaerens]